MSESESTELSNVKKESKAFDDQNELDYEEELDEAKETANPDIKPDINASEKATEEADKENAADESGDGEIDDDSDGEVKTDDEDGKVKSEAGNEEKEIKAPATPETEEDGEINDGEKVKKAFIPRVLCKYYQRGKCTWGRTCKFLHPGVNDTGNYNFLEFQDPNAKVFQQQSMDQAEAEQQAAAEREAIREAEPPTETAWERGLRQAREMKEKARLRKLAAKEAGSFKDKQMNLSLKEFEDEVENDERYMNVEKAPNFEDEEDEDLHLFAQSGRVKGDRGSAYRPADANRDQYANRQYDDSRRSSGHHRSNNSRQPSNDYRNDNKGNTGNSGYRGGANRAKADEWHDPWDRSRQQSARKGGNVQRRDRSRSYSSSDSDSRSRSRSSYSSGSSRSYSSRSSGSSRSGSGSPRRKGDRKSRRDSKKATNPKQLTNDLKKKIESLKNKNLAGNKGLPGRQISDVSLKKAGLDNSGDKGKKKKASSRSRSNSSASSYGSSDSKSDDDISNDESDSFSDDDDGDYRKKKSKSKNLKRSAQDAKAGSDSKRHKGTDKPGASDKKQMIKDQLKLLESALKKKSMAK